MATFKPLTAAVFGLALTGLFIFMEFSGGWPLELLELKSFDALMRIRSSGPGPVILVEMDDAGASSGRRSWTRSLIGEGIARIREGRPRVIGLNLDLSRPEEIPGAEALDHLAEMFNTTLSPDSGKAGLDFLILLRDVRASLDGDRRLAQAMGAAGSVILPLPAHHEAAAPLPVFLNAAGGTGHSVFSIDIDGKVRRHKAFHRHGGVVAPSFPLALAAAYLGVSPKEVEPGTAEGIRIGPAAVPLNAGAEIVAPAEAAGEPRRFSLADVLSGKLSPELFQDKLVLIAPGASAAAFPAEAVAGSVTSILNGSCARRPSWAPAAEWVALVLAGCLVVVVFPRLSPGRGGVLLAILLFLSAACAAGFFMAGGIWLRIIDVLILLAGGFLGSAALNRLPSATRRPESPEKASRPKSREETAGADAFQESAGEGAGDAARESFPTLGRYRIIRQLGQGAMGVVYLGEDPRINRLTAIKTFHFLNDTDPEMLETVKHKFFAEAKSAGQLSHPHIVTIFDAGEEQGVAYIAMEYLEGETLKTFTRPGNLLSQRKVIDHMADIAEALDYAHEHGVVHRDIKPANIMLLDSGLVKITDFGVARIPASSQTRTGVVKGTPFYMSPEQISGAKVDGRSDIFALGVMMFQLLTGRLPFTGNSLAALMHQIVKSPCPDPRHFDPRILKPLGLIVQKALVKEKEKRYQRAGDLAAHLRELGRRLSAAGNRRPA